jgi:hypothetical protein
MSAASQVRPALIKQPKELHLPAIRACFEETARRAKLLGAWHAVLRSGHFSREKCVQQLRVGEKLAQSSPWRD